MISLSNLNKVKTDIIIKETSWFMGCWNFFLRRNSTIEHENHLISQTVSSTRFPLLTPSIDIYSQIPNATQNVEPLNPKNERFTKEIRAWLTVRGGWTNYNKFKQIHPFNLALGRRRNQSCHFNRHFRIMILN